VYKLQHSEEFDVKLLKLVKSTFHNQYKEEKLVFQGSSELSVDGIQALQMFSTFADKTIQQQAMKKIKKTLSRLFKEAGTDSEDSFSLLTKNADIALELNFEVLGLVNAMRIQVDPVSYGLTERNHGLYANYFL